MGIDLPLIWAIIIGFGLMMYVIMDGFDLGIGILFLMWQVPYVVALIHPQRNFRSLLEALLMQGIGLVGEALLLRSIPLAHPTLRTSILRFIIFDAGGLLLLIVAFAYTFRVLKSRQGESHVE